MANNKKKTRKKIIIFGSIGLVLIILAVVIIIGSRKDTIITVQTEKIGRRTITQVVEATGKIQPQTQVKINAEVSGEIIDLPVKEGDRVKRGQLLVRIKPDTYLADKEQSVANVNRAKSYLEQREADFKKVESEYRRQQQLFQKGLISESDLETIRNSFDVAKAAVSGAKFDVENADALLNRSKENLNKTSIYSPIDGVVSQLLSKLGERVSGSSFMQGTEIMTVSNLSLMESRVEVNENDVVMISINDTARVEVDAYPDRTFNALVYQIANTATTTGAGTQEEVTNFEVRLLMLDRDVVFRPGMSCSARIETETHANVLAVPLQSVTTREGKKRMEPAGEAPQEESGEVSLEQKTEKTKKPDEVIFVVRNGFARKQMVKTGISSDLYIEITSGAEEGAEVVKGNYRAISRELEDSTRVRVDNKGKDTWKTKQ
jgi:HlyD family secretion protein